MRSFLVLSKALLALSIAITVPWAATTWIEKVRMTGQADIAIFSAQLAGAKQTNPYAPGRWQIVNPTPAMARNIALLDTATGNTWIMCIGEHGAASWCLAERTDSASVAPKP